MPTPAEAKRALGVLTETAVEDVLETAAQFRGSPTVRRAALLEAVPALIDYYGSGSAALAADVYDEQRAAAGVLTVFSAAPIVEDRVVRQRRAVAWAAEPWMEPAAFGAAAGSVFRSRIQEVVVPEVARPYRTTTTGNLLVDGKAYGWSRQASANACKFCLMLAARGAVYKAGTVGFAAHDNCLCTPVPLFGQMPADVVEASSLQYRVNAGRVRTPAQRAALRDYLNSNFPDARG